MMKNKNGIKVDNHVNKKKENRVKPLEYALHMITYYRFEKGIEIESTVPKFSPLRRTMREDGWRVKRSC